MTVKAGVREFHPRPSLPHVGLGLLPDTQRGERVVHVRVYSIDCKHRHISRCQTVSRAPQMLTYSVLPVTGARRPFNRGRRSWDDFQRLDFVAFKPEEESKVDRTTGKVSDKPAGYDGLSFFLIGRERLACICVFFR